MSKSLASWAVARVCSVFWSSQQMLLHTFRYFLCFSNIFSQPLVVVRSLTLLVYLFATWQISLDALTWLLTCHASNSSKCQPSIWASLHILPVVYYRAPIQCALAVDREWYPFSYILAPMVYTIDSSIAGGDDPANDMPKQRQSSRENSSNVNIYYFNLILGFVNRTRVMGATQRPVYFELRARWRTHSI